ncbi:nucleoside hydrolase [Blastococcus haudaquaticus]|uniref:Inosine-uridine nucleoside N-ribohydrolase n=1 Tax=Blastococcus haudaquaticus TaxID=1938745 RepID=A0A286GT52_9ACTN|nr:nucleoside hydrolase [Blastococcus haudaquaticus]SOD98154.1 Inosine-uridine nucleoside N-ribohydrolase [Blastococcus haudaquaticus]
MSLRIAERCRVVVDNDWAGDPDGLVALAHHLLSPANRVVAVTGSQNSPVFGSPAGTAAAGTALAQELIDLVGTHRPVVAAGCDVPIGGGDTSSAAADAIVAEARRDDPLPLFLVCAGPLTNVAQALRQAPDIAERLTLVWIGGALGADAQEYNRDTDPQAADEVLGRAELAVRQFPLETYRRCSYSVAELEHDIGGAGRVGAWLWQRFLELPLPDFVQLGEVWPLGDSPPVLVTALDDASSTWSGPPTRRVYTDVDVRLLFADLLARLRLHQRRTD